MSRNLKETPLKDLSSVSDHIKNPFEQETIDTCTFGQISGKSALDKQFIQKFPEKEFLKQVKRNLFVDQTNRKQPEDDQQNKSSQQSDENTDQQQEQQQMTILTQKQFKQILSSDLTQLKQLQWLINTFNKSINPLSKYTSKIVNKLQGYLRKSTFFNPTTQSRKNKILEYEQFLIDQINTQKDSVQQRQQKPQTLSQFTLICSQYLLFVKQAIKKSLQSQLSPYKQQYLQSIILVIEDLSTFKKLQNDDLRNQMCQIIQEIEKNMIGKDQKKYARHVHKLFVNFMFKKMQEEEKLSELVQ